MNSSQKADFWITLITNAFNDCKKFLSSSKSNKIAYYWKTYGFSNLNTYGKMEISDGIDEEYWPEFKDVLISLYSVPKEFQKH